MSLSEAQSPTKRQPGSDAERPQRAPSRTVPGEITVKQPPSAPSAEALASDLLRSIAPYVGLVQALDLNTRIWTKE